jgi:hypothetical protein
MVIHTHLRAACWWTTKRRQHVISKEKLMSAPVTTRRVAVFTMICLTAWIAATTGASAMRPEPPLAPSGHSAHQVPTVTSSGGTDLTVWLWALIAVVAAAAIAAGVATARRHRIQPPATGQAAH